MWECARGERDGRVGCVLGDGMGGHAEIRGSLANQRGRKTGRVYLVSTTLPCLARICLRAWFGVNLFIVDFKVPAFADSCKRQTGLFDESEMCSATIIFAPYSMSIPLSCSSSRESFLLRTIGCASQRYTNPLS
jgi:hypothetical protein